jgi:hypothetical protein
VAYRRYFAGDLPLPPEETRRDVEQTLRRLRNLNMRRAADRFRYSALEAQFNSYAEMYSRRVRAREEGKVPTRPHHAPDPGAQRHDVEAGVAIGPTPASEAVEALFSGLRSRNPATTMDLDAFRSYLVKQVAQIREKTGCASVQFRLVDEDGKVKLKAKPLSTEAG